MDASRRGFLRLSRVLPTSRVFTSGYVNTETILHFFISFHNTINDSLSHLISSLSFSFAFLSFFVFFILFLFLLFLSLLSFFLLSAILILWDTFLQTLQFYFEAKSFQMSFSRAINVFCTCGVSSCCNLQSHI